jgi:hypothetical protein
MTLDYSEKRQRVLFLASRAMRRVAAEVLDDMQNSVECSNPATIRWAISLAKTTAELANDLEQRGHEFTIAAPGSETANFKSKREYEKAIDAFEDRVRAAGGEYWLPGAGDTMHPSNDPERTYAL